MLDTRAKPFKLIGMMMIGYTYNSIFSCPTSYMGPAIKKLTQKKPFSKVT